MLVNGHDLAWPLCSSFRYFIFPDEQNRSISTKSMLPTETREEILQEGKE